MKYFALIGVLALAVACGGKKEPGFITSGGGGVTSLGGGGGHAGRTSTGGKGGASGEAGDTAEGGEAGEAGASDGSSLAPTVMIVSPEATSDPSDGTVLTGLTVTVTCSVTASNETRATGVQQSSVKIQMFGADSKQIGADGSVMSTSNANEYAATFVLNGVPTGALSFTCSASDTGATAHVGQASVGTYFDGGPVIAITSPPDKSAHSLGPLPLDFSALAAPLNSGDHGADVDTVTLTVNGVKITSFTAMTGMPGYYDGSVDLSDSKTFTPTPTGSVAVIIKATNKRGTTATGAFSFIVDSIGPTITVLSPSISSVQFIGHQTDVQFTVVDEIGGSGVDTNSVTVQINTTDPIPYQEGNSWHLGSDGKTFDFTFHTENYPATLGDKLTFSARDNAGNVAAGVTALYYVDTVPPIIDLQPGLLQESKKSGSIVYCSEPFDPLGDSPHDLTDVTDVSIFRALLWDLGNTVDSATGISFFSDIDVKAGVRMYFQEDASMPLLKYTGTGTSAGAICNDIADHSLPFISLFPLGQSGSAFYDSKAPIPTDYACIDGSDAPIQNLCNGNSALTRVIQHETATPGTNAPVVYAFQPDTSTGPLCTGGQLPLSTTVTKDGWVCAAVMGQDVVGNVAVSAPIRLCLDAPDEAGAGFVGKPACATDKSNPPTCVVAPPAGCVPPPHFDRDVIRRP